MVSPIGVSPNGVSPNWVSLIGASPDGVSLIRASPNWVSPYDPSVQMPLVQMGVVLELDCPMHCNVGSPIKVGGGPFHSDDCIQ